MPIIICIYSMYILLYMGIMFKWTKLQYSPHWKSSNGSKFQMFNHSNYGYFSCTSTTTCGCPSYFSSIYFHIIEIQSRIPMRFITYIILYKDNIITIFVIVSYFYANPSLVRYYQAVAVVVNAIRTFFVKKI